MSAAVVERLYREHRRRLLRYARACVGWDDAEDVLQTAVETMLRRGLPADAGIGHGLRAVKHAALHAQRDRLRMRRDVRRTDRLGGDPPSSWSLEDAIVGRAVLGAFMRALSPAERRGLLAVAFGPPCPRSRDSQAATRARRRLRALRDGEAPP